MISLIVIFVLLINSAHRLDSVYALFEFPSIVQGPSDVERTKLDQALGEEFENFIELGADSVKKQRSLEENLLNSLITVRNGSSSHISLLDSLPNHFGKEDSKIAHQILAASLYAYHTKCIALGISGPVCEAYLSATILPGNSQLRRDCVNMLQRREAYRPFRRLLPRRYIDGFHKMDSSLDDSVSPRYISFQSVDTNWEARSEHTSEANLILAQWTQFIEHDLSKPIVTSMNNGDSIECCNSNNANLSPRYRHPACAPLLNVAGPNDRVTCLNYVRTALSVGMLCNFGAQEKLNQANAVLDLSQLYGITKQDEDIVRTFSNGLLKCYINNSNSNVRRELLPMATVDNLSAFCARKNEKNNANPCFLAADSRVNSNPLAISIYTLFLRNHNRVAQALLSQHPRWSDAQLFYAAKSLNIDLYRHIVFDEWLPVVLGDRISQQINQESILLDATDKDFQISNEFAVAALRFYFSMLPESLLGFPTGDSRTESINKIKETRSVPDQVILKDELYSPSTIYTSEKIDDIIHSLLRQRALSIDAIYTQGLISKNISRHNTAIDILAFDIQRGRDHGLQDYAKYVEVCNRIKIRGWDDFSNVMSAVNIEKLRSIYNDWSNIDLIVGGISENPVNGSIVGPTFACILGEQFSKIRRWQKKIYTIEPSLLSNKNLDFTRINNLRLNNSLDLLCSNSDLQQVQQNIFQLPSVRNRYMRCSR